MGLVFSVLCPNSVVVLAFSMMMTLTIWMELMMILRMILMMVSMGILIDFDGSEDG
jgi:hypothetical protein